MKFKKGDKVKYTSGQWGNTSTNPKWGSRYGKVEGTIIGIKQTGLPYQVKWDNGCKNVYEERDLKLVSRVSNVPEDLFEL